MSEPKRVLVLCTGNSCRSQMAEGWINQTLGARWSARSAGTSPAERVAPLAIDAMSEVGISMDASWGHAPWNTGATPSGPWTMGCKRSRPWTRPGSIS